MTDDEGREKTCNIKKRTENCSETRVRVFVRGITSPAAICKNDSYKIAVAG